MNRYIRSLLLLGCAALASILVGCAKERTGPFDVPAAVPGSGYAQGAVPEGVARAAAELAALKVHFAFDRSEILPEARTALDRAAGLLRQYPSIRVGLHGHCDARGGEEYNYGLGERRARSVYGYLTRSGVPAAQLDMVTHGKKNPAVPGRTESAYAMNRRVEFIVLTTCF